LLGAAATTSSAVTVTSTTTITTRMPTTPHAPEAGAWTYHRGLNCFSGVGADPAPGDLVGTMPLASCKETCSAETQCEGIIVVRSEDTGPCWLRMNIDPSACWKESAWDLWMLNLDSSAPTAAPSAPMPTTPVAGQWTYHRGLNCFSGAGADPAPGDLVGSMPLSACKRACSAEPQCTGIIVVHGEDPGSCWLRKNIDISACWRRDMWDLWLLD
jgi:hypothetical protein